LCQPNPRLFCREPENLVDFRLAKKLRQIPCLQTNSHSAENQNNRTPEQPGAEHSAPDEDQPLKSTAVAWVWIPVCPLPEALDRDQTLGLRSVVPLASSSWRLNIRLQSHPIMPRCEALFLLLIQHTALRGSMQLRSHRTGQLPHRLHRSRVVKGPGSACGSRITGPPAGFASMRREHRGEFVEALIPACVHARDGERHLLVQCGGAGGEGEQRLAGAVLSERNLGQAVDDDIAVGI